jgi:hypothetical protein
MTGVAGVADASALGPAGLGGREEGGGVVGRGGQPSRTSVGWVSPQSSSPRARAAELVDVKINAPTTAANATRSSFVTTATCPSGTRIKPAQA